MFTVESPSAVRWSGSLVTIRVSCGLRACLRFHRPKQLHASPSAASICKPIRHADVRCVPVTYNGKNQSRAGPDRHANSQSAVCKDFLTYVDIDKAASRLGLSLRLDTVGPFFRVQVMDLLSKEVLGAAQGVVKLWTSGRILHLDSARLTRSSLCAKRPVFGIAFLLGAVAVRHGYDQNCMKAELLAIKDTDIIHSKLVRYYTRMGFKRVRDLTGESLLDMPQMLIWGGAGTRMDASIEELLMKWSPALRKAAE